MNTLAELPVPDGIGRAPLRPLPGMLILIAISGYLLLVLPLWIDNNAGSGLSLPQNILAWATIASCCLAAILNIARSRHFFFARFMIFAVAGTAMLLLPALWSANSLWLHRALPRLYGTAGALLFVLVLCQIPFSAARRRGVLMVVVASALIQSVEAMIQAWMPHAGMMLMDFSGTLPYGIFQQRNLLGSWLAVGCSAALYLSLTACSRGRATGWILALYPLSAAVILCQSRTGLAGMLIAGLLTALADLPNCRRRPLALFSRAMIVASLLIWCTGVSLWTMPAGKPADFKHTAATAARLRMLDGTLEMISQHPFAGNGMGSFEARFPPSLEQTGLASVEGDTITHPHNEFLFAEAEGGVIGLSGMLLLAGIWLWPLVKCLQDRSNQGRLFQPAATGDWLLPLIGLPVVLHMMTEYPLYLSAPHLLLLAVLFRLGLPAQALRKIRVPALLWMLLPVMAAVLLASLVLLAAGFRTQSELTVAEEEINNGFIPSLPQAGWRTFTQSERLDYDRHMLMAVSPGFTQRPDQMAAFKVWGERWLSVHNNAEVSAVLIFLANYRGDRVAAEQLRHDAARVFINDPRFMPESRHVPETE